MTLQEIRTSYVNHKIEEFFPIEVTKGEEIQYRQEFDPSCLKFTYFDELHKCQLPIFAASSIENNEGCRINVKLLKTGPEQRSANGSLANMLGKIDIWEEAYKNTKKPISNTLADIAIALGAVIGITTGIWVAFREDTARLEGIPIPYAIAIVLGLGTLGMLALGMFAMFVSGRIERIVCKKWLPTTPENHLVQGIEYQQKFSAAFPGAIPNEVRILIRENSQEYRDIHLVWEATNQWVSNGVKSTIRPNQDPLILGETSKGKFILIGCFDVIPRESCIRDECTS